MGAYRSGLAGRRAGALGGYDRKLRQNETNHAHVLARMYVVGLPVCRRMYQTERQLIAEMIFDPRRRISIVHGEKSAGFTMVVVALASGTEAVCPSKKQMLIPLRWRGPP